jgi:hypothetical protein
MILVLILQYYQSPDIVQDGYMNLALEKTEEHVDGVKKRSYGDAFVRGNNGTTLRSSSI